jgi:DNA mismatch repair protein MSH6
MHILPRPGADEECDEADAAVQEAEDALEVVLKEVRRSLK